MSFNRLMFWLYVLGLIDAFGGSVSYHTTLNPEACHEVHLGRFTIPKRVAFLQDAYTGYCRVALRSGGETVLYFGMVCLEPGGFPSPEKYAVDLSGRTRTHRIDDEEWRSAQEVRSSLRTIHPRPEDAGIQYKGPVLPRSGPEWFGEGAGNPAPSHLSLTGIRAAVNSWDGFEIIYSFLDPTSLFKRSKVKGRYWVDLYDTRSAKPLIRIQGSFHGAAPSSFLGYAGFYSDRYYIMPVGGTTHGYEFSLRRLLVCDADAASHKDNSGFKERK